jgi:hypothetical protein
MSIKQPTRIDVFTELTSPKGTFDYEKCCKLLGDDYDSFVKFCDAVKLIPEEIETMEVVNLNIPRDNKKVIFEVCLTSGEKMQFET